MRTIAAVAFGLVLLLLAALCGLAAAVTLALPTGGSSGETNNAATGLPESLEAVYRDAAGRYCEGLPWEVLAAVGGIESRHGGGHVDPTTGEVDREILGPPIDGTHGRARIPDPTSPDGWAHAEGPMQFLPSTWRRWATLAPERPAGATPSPHNMWDAIHTAARVLCGGQPTISDLRAAVYGYNHDWGYVDVVFALADRYRDGAPLSDGG